MRRSVIPGFGLAFGITVLYLGAIVLLPLCALILKASGIGLPELWGILSSPRTLSAIRVTVTRIADSVRGDDRMPHNSVRPMPEALKISAHSGSSTIAPR